MRNLILTLIILNINFATAQNYIDSLDFELNKLSAESLIPGFGASIVNKDGILYTKGFGYANKENKIPYTKNTIQPIASISKTTIAVAIMKAIEEGYFTLETDINKILPFKITNPNFKDDTIRIKHLVTHTSGIIDKVNINFLQGYYLLEKVDFKNTKYTTPEKQALKKVEENKKLTLAKYLEECLSKEGKWYSDKTFSKNRPGEFYEYSNIGADLAAYIVEVVTGKSFDSYTEEIILKPLKLNSTAWNNEKFDKEKLAILYSKNGSPLPLYSNSSYPSGELRTSCLDFSKYLIEIINGYQGNGTLLNSDSYKLMLSSIFKQESQTKKNGYNNSGVFWEIKKNGAIGHTGGNPGVTAVMYYNSKEEIGIILFTNTEIENSKKLTKQFVRVWKTLTKYSKKL